MRKFFLGVFVAMCALQAATVAAGAQQNATPNPGTGAVETPTQFYLRYRTAVQNAKSLDDVTKFWPKSVVTEFMQAPADQRTDLAGIKRMNNMVSDVKVVSASIAPDGKSATMKLAASSGGGKKTGTASLVQEDGAWKLAAPEKWQEESAK